MADFDDLIDDLKQKRDELRVQMNLASRELKDEFEELEEKFDELKAKAREIAADAELDETGKGLSKAIGQLGHEIKLGFQRIRDAIRDSD